MPTPLEELYSIVPKRKPVKRPVIDQPHDLGIRHIALTKGFVAIVDTSDYEWLSQWNWHVQKSCDGLFYANRTVHTDEIGGRHLQMHSQILPVKKGYRVDHINGNGLDNRRSNLRLATFRQNNYNRKISRNNKSGFKGVIRVTGKFGEAWRSQISIDGKRKYLGQFPSAELAHSAYMEVAIAHYGEFARPR